MPRSWELSLAFASVLQSLAPLILQRFFGATEARREVIRRFETFDAANAKCFVESERQRLLAGLETGFGSLEQFNSLVAGIFTQDQEQNEEVQRRSERRPSIRTITSTTLTESSALEDGRGGRKSSNRSSAGLVKV